MHTSALANMGYNKPTDQMYALKDEVFLEIDSYLKLWKRIVEEDLVLLNQSVRNANIDAVSVPLKTPK